MLLESVSRVNRWISASHCHCREDAGKAEDVQRFMKNYTHMKTQRMKSSQENHVCVSSVIIFVERMEISEKQLQIKLNIFMIPFMFSNVILKLLTKAQASFLLSILIFIEYFSVYCK